MRVCRMTRIRDRGIRGVNYRRWMTLEDVFVEEWNVKSPPLGYVSELEDKQ